MNYEVKKNFRDKDTGVVHLEGQQYSNDNEERIEKLIKSGYLKDPKAAKQEEELDAAGIKHTGGGWYELPNGEKVQGKEEAVKAFADLEKRGE